MILKSIKLENFTNYKKIFCKFNTGFNILIGNNAQGKSNILESIFYLAMNNSFRNKRDIELILWKKKYFKLNACFKNKDNEENNIDILYFKEKKEKKEIILNNNKIEKLKEYIGSLNVVYFSPDNLYIIKGEPSIRRKYIDEELIQTEKYYYLSLNNYKKILEHRNFLLKKKYKKKKFLEIMNVWEEQLIKYGTFVLKNRIEMIEELKKISKKIHFKLTEKKEVLEIQYDTKLPVILLKSNKIEIFKKEYFNELKKNINNDIEKGYTCIGPHRDDLILKINGISAKKFASQGQQRTIALSLKISEIEMIKKKKQEYPIFLLDDVLSELDKKRKNKLFSIINDKVQTIITTTDLNDLNKKIQKKSKIIEIKNNTLKERSNY